MGSGTKLTSKEIGAIKAYHDQGLSLRQIAEKIGRSKTVVSNCLKLGEEYGATPRSGRPKKLSDRECRRILRLSSEGNHSCNDILKETQLPVCRRTVLNAIQDSGFMEYNSYRMKTHLDFFRGLQRF